MTDLACRKALPEDRPALLALWQQVFGDDAAFAGRMLDDFAGAGNVYVAASESEAVAALLLAVPCALAGQQGVYLYGLATQPRLRRGGVMTALMRHAEADKAGAGAAFAALVPASVPLYAYYQKRGYTVAANLRHVMLEPARSPEVAPRQQALTADALEALRTRYLPVPAVTFPPVQMAMVVEDLADDTRLAVTDAAYAVYFTAGEALYLPELAAESDEAATALVEALMKQGGYCRAHATVAAGGGLFARQGAVHLAALIKPLAEDFSVKAPYLRFGIDDVADSFTMWGTGG